MMMMIRYRTLVMAMREFTEAEWLDLERELHAAEIDIENREEAVSKAYGMTNSSFSSVSLTEWNS